MAIITGSASGGLGIALSTLGETFVELSQTTGISPDVFHRIAAVASGASIFPNNGALLTLIAVTGVSLRDTYKDVFIVSIHHTNHRIICRGHHGCDWFSIKID